MTIDWHIGLWYNLLTMANTPKKIAPPAFNLPRDPRENEMVVLNVPFDDREIAKKELGAQFDGNMSVWFINPNAPWNRNSQRDPSIMDAAKKIINDKKWFRGFSHRAPDKYNPNVNYSVPLAEFTWIGDAPTLTDHAVRYDVKKNNYMMYSWCSKSMPIGSTTASILIDTLGYADKQQWTAYLILWMRDGTTISSINQVTMDEARKYWDEFATNTDYVSLSPGTHLPWVSTVYGPISTFLQKIEAKAARLKSPSHPNTTDTQYAITA